MIQSQFVIDSNFVVRGMNGTGAQPTNIDRSKFISENSLDTAIATVHAAKDLPYLTMNDKVFAARYTVAITVPSSTEPKAKPAPKKDKE